MIYPKYFIIKLVMLGFISLLLSCTDNVDSTQGVSDVIWEPAGLEAHSVFDLEVSNGVITAAANDDVYQSDLIDGSSWEELGLNLPNDRWVESLIVRNKSEIIVSLQFNNRPELAEDTPSIYRMNNGDSRWEPVHSERNNVDGIARIFNLEILDDEAGTLLGHHGGIVKSTDGGYHWDMLYEDYALFIHVSPHHPEQIWVGAHVEIQAPSLAKSEDGGASWTPLHHEIQDAVSGDATAQAALLHPEDPQIALVGLTSSATGNNKAVLSQDGGETFETVLEETGIRAMAHGIESEERVYASGQHITGKPFVAISPDFGINWETFVYEDAEIEDRVFAREMVVVNRNGQEVVYLATNKGVFQAEVH